MILAKTGFAHKLNPNGYSDYVCPVWSIEFYEPCKIFRTLVY